MDNEAGRKVVEWQWAMQRADRAARLLQTGLTIEPLQAYPGGRTCTLVLKPLDDGRGYPDGQALCDALMEYTPQVLALAAKLTRAKAEDARAAALADARQILNDVESGVCRQRLTEDE